jgi:lipocalin-like protein
MNRRIILGLAALAAVTLLPGSAVGQQKSLKEQLVGTWTLASWEQQRPDGSKFQRFGANPKGVNIFDANGRFAMIFLHPDLPKLASSDPSTLTAEEQKASVGRSIAYYGTYTVDEGAKTITLNVEGSTFPNQIGADNRRTIMALTGDELKYQNARPLTGGQINTAYKRAAAATN